MYVKNICKLKAIYHSNDSLFSYPAMAVAKAVVR